MGNLFGSGKIIAPSELPEYRVVERGTTDKGQEYVLANVGNGGEPCGDPLVIFDGKAYLLTWDDILEIAQRAGLFGGYKYLQISSPAAKK